MKQVSLAVRYLLLAGDVALHVEKKLAPTIVGAKCPTDLEDQRGSHTVTTQR